MFEIKKGDAFKAYFKMVDSTDFATPENGVTSGDVTGAYTKDGAAGVALNMAAANRWTDLSGDVSGLYVVTVPTGATDTIGELIVAVIDDGGGVAGAARVFKVVSHPSDDIFDKVSALNDPTVASIADAVWDELSTGHTGAGKAGKMLFDVISNINANLPSANAVADAVWNELSTGHTDAGKAGRKMWHKVSQIQNSIAQIRIDIDSVSSAVSLVFQEVDGVIASIQSVAPDAASMVWNNINANAVYTAASFGAKVNDIDDQISILLADNNVLSNAIKTVDNQISVLLADNNSLSSAIATIDNQVSILLTDNNTLSAAIQTIDNEVSTANDGINALSNVVKNTGVAVAATAIANASSHLLHQAHITIGQTAKFSTVAGSLRLARAGAIGDWTVAADTLDVMDTNGTSQKVLTLTPGGGPYTARA